MIEPPLDNFKRYPRMAHWFNPILLFKLLGNVVLSAIFGKRADRRLMVAALDTVSNEKHLERATRVKEFFKPDADGAVWFDFVADLGDGFDSTYAVASLLAREQLGVDDLKLPRGQLLVLGGDEVYPEATADAYRNQFRQPYAWAFPDHDRKADAGIPLFAIPGNHDWYDGLVMFLAFFCRQRPWHIGSWRTQQRRSYFAFQITDKWWLWAMDVQLADDMDQPQADYFTAIAAAMPEGSKIILCSAEPGWLYTGTNSKSWEITDFAVAIAEGADRNLTVPVVLSGDTHHYSRYSAANGKQFITSGGGGAFLHPTHQLQDNVQIDWRGHPLPLSLTTSPAAGHAQNGKAACYPSREISKSLVWHNLYFAFTNWDFSILMGAIYWLMGIGLGLRDQWDTYIFVAAIFGWTLIGYTVKQEKSTRAAVLISSALHALAHIVVVIFAARSFASFNASHFMLSGEWYSVWKWLAVLLAEMGAIGFLVGSTLFGLNLVATCAWLRMNTNDAFSAFRLGGYCNFLRFRIKGDNLEIYAIGLTDVPRRDQWKPAGAPRTPHRPVFEAQPPLQPHLIEKIEVTA